MEERHSFETGDPDLRLPDCCACCLGPAEESWDLTIFPGEEQETSWTFPYCRFCLKHLKGHSDDWKAGGVAGGLLGVLALWLRGFPHMAIDEIFLIVCAAGGIAWGVKYYTSTCAARSGPNCSGDEAVVGAYPTSATTLRFVFANRDYGEKVEKLNAPR